MKRLASFGLLLFLLPAHCADPPETKKVEAAVKRLEKKVEAIAPPAPKAAPATKRAADPLIVTIPAAVQADADNLDAVVPLTTNAKVLAWRVPKASGILVWPQYKPGELLPWCLYLTRCKKVGEWELIVTGVAADKLEQSVCIVTVGTPVPPGPVPPVPPGPPAPAPLPPTDKPTAATYFYEKDTHVIPNQVLSALNKLNREHGIVATVFEADIKAGTGDVPKQYRTSLEAAKKAGLPALVVAAGEQVLSVLKDPKDEQQILDAVKVKAVRP